MNVQYLYSAYYDVKDTDYSEQAVLLALAFCCNKDTRQCNPTIGTLASMTHFNPKSVEKFIKRLRDKGYISWESGGLNIGSNRYKLHLPMLTTSVDAEELDIPPTAGTHPAQSGNASHPQRDVTSRPGRDKIYNNINNKDTYIYRSDGKNVNNYNSSNASYYACQPPQADYAGIQNTAEEEAAFCRWWGNYPDRCMYKGNFKTTKARTLYIVARREFGDDVKFDEMILANTDEWNKKVWAYSEDKYIPAPSNFLKSGKWKAGPTQADIKRVIEKENSYKSPSQLDDERRLKRERDGNCTPSDWQLCREECENCRRKEDRTRYCAKGYRVPTWWHAEHPHPPRECPDYQKRATPLDDDELAEIAGPSPS